MPALLVLLSMAAISTADNAQNSLSYGSHEDHWLARDKASHLALGFSLVGFGYHLARFEGRQGRGAARAASFGASAAVGLGKELWDRRRPRGRFSYKDLICDLAGAGLGMAIFTINK